MKTVEEIRFEKLMRLREAYRPRLGKRDYDAEFARQMGILEAHYSQIKYGRRRVGPIIARRVEQNARLEPGSMDTESVPQDTLNGAYIEGVLTAGNSGGYAIREPAAKEYLAMPRHEATAYFVRVGDQHLAPRVLAGEYLLVYPTADCDPGSDILVGLKNGQRLAKRLLYQRDGELGFEEINEPGSRLLYPVTDIAFLHLIVAVFCFKNVPLKQSAT